MSNRTDMIDRVQAIFTTPEKSISLCWMILMDSVLQKLLHETNQEKNNTISGPSFLAEPSNWDFYFFL